MGWAGLRCRQAGTEQLGLGRAWAWAWAWGGHGHGHEHGHHMGMGMNVGMTWAWAGQGRGQGLGGALGWAGIFSHTFKFNEHSKLMKMQFEEKFTQFLFVLLLRV